MTSSTPATTITLHHDPATAAPTRTRFSYLDIAGLMVGDWLGAYPEDHRRAEEVADAILSSFSVERLHALVLAHLQA